MPSADALDEHSIVIIAGPTTTGKSEISELLARTVNGAIINSDNYYLYANDIFRIGLGLSRDEPPKDIQTYLFGGRHLSQPKPNPDEFFVRVVEAANDACQKGLIPIVQGCSFTLNQRLITSGISSRIFIPIWTDTSSLLLRCHARVKQMIDERLLNEVREIIACGLDTSWIATEGIIYQPTIRYVMSGGSNIDDLIEAITRGIVAKAKEQERKYRTLDGVWWVPHDNSPQAAFREIYGKLYTI